MKALHIALLGQPQIVLNGAPIAADFYGHKKACALLYYLAETRKEQTRLKLASLLWPDVPGKTGLANLRGRSGLTTLKPFSAFIKRHGTTSLSITLCDSFTTDIDAFERVFAMPSASVASLEAAAELYRGPFLMGFDSHGFSPEIERWVLTTRERLRSRAIDILHRLMHHYSTWQEYDKARHYAERLLEIEPWLEEAHRQLMLLQAYQGQRSKAMAQYETCTRILTQDLGAKPSAYTTEIYDQIRNDTLELPPPIPFLAPSLTPHFVGRSSLIETLLARIAPTQPENGIRNRPNLYALIGMGGIGKTTLATHLAHALRKRFPAGVLWADALESKPEDVIDSWAAVFGFDFSKLSGLAARTAAWRGLTEKKALLIIVDDVWEAAQIRPLLPSGQASMVIMTTRNHDLAALLNAEPVDVPELEAASGLALLRQILGDARVSAELESAQHICALLGQLPLALEILAKRLKTRRRMSLSQIVSYLDEINAKLNMLTLEDRAVRASFELSWKTLDAELRKAFALLGVFGGRSVDADAFAAVAECGAAMARMWLEDLTALSLIKRDASNQTLDLYRQHGLLAEFASEKGERTVDFKHAQHRFAKHFLRVARDHADHYDNLRPNWANFQHAIKIAHGQRDWNTAYAIAASLRTAWLAQGRYDELTAAHRLAHTAALAQEDTLNVAEGQFFLGLAATEQARYADADMHLQESLRLFEELGEFDGVMRSKLEIGRIALEQGELDRAGQYLADSHFLGLEHSLAKGVATSAYRRARLAYRAGAYGDSQALALEALQQCDPLEDTTLQTLTLNLLARNAMVQAKQKRDDSAEWDLLLNDAEQYLTQAHQLAVKSQSQSALSTVLLEIGSLQSLLGNSTASIDALKKASQLFHQMGDIRSEGQAQYRLGCAFYETDQTDHALQFAHASEANYLRIKAERPLVSVKALIGDILKQQTHFSDAKRYFTDALQLARATDYSKAIAPLQKRIDTLPLTDQ